MSGNEIKLRNGDLWTSQQFLDHYIQPPPSRTPTPVTKAASPVPVDMSWYMSEGPGRYYHPGMFPIINTVAGRHDLAPGVHDLWSLAPNGEKDPSVKAGLSNYFTDPNSADYKTRALVFGNESARISGNVVVDPNGSKTFKDIEIRPYDSDFNFYHKDRGWLFEHARASARKIYDPQNLGVSYDILYRGQGDLTDPFSDRGIGRKYYPFTGEQLNVALNNPGNTPPGLLPSAAGAPPFINEQQRYLNQVNGDAGQAVAPTDNPFALPDASSASQNPSGRGIANWIAGLAGVDPSNPGLRVAPPQTEPLRGIVSNRPMPDWPFPPPIFNPR